MNARDAVDVVARLLDAYVPQLFGTDQRERVARRYEDFVVKLRDPAAARRVVDDLCANMKRLPTIAELLEAYNGETGEMPDPLRNMSPPVRLLPPLSESEQAEVAAIRHDLSQRFRRRYGDGRTTEREGGDA